MALGQMFELHPETLSSWSLRFSLASPCWWELCFPCGYWQSSKYVGQVSKLRQQSRLCFCEMVLCGWSTLKDSRNLAQKI
eukprot:5499251-Amphidinium_carterae.1